jgi:2-polyprenyl-3-methyl-5-hydroxy-6-metoxy-1,4-benzoquinol methylase
MVEDHDEERAHLAREAREIWEANAEFWSRAMGDGNRFHKALVAPAVEKLLELRPGQRVLDLACGNGHFSSRLCQLGAQVTAVDFSRGFVERARDRLAPFGARAECLVVDATDGQALEALAGGGAFDAVVSNMALMDMVEIAPLARALRSLLKPGGSFVLSIAHPCFNAPGTTTLGAEEEDRQGRIAVQRYVRVSGYVTPTETKGVGIVGQPAPQYHFHRPISALLRPFFDAGLVMDRLEEPTFPAGTPSDRPFSWEHYPEIPPVLAVRLRPT